jgi:hypothetical protein
VWGGELFEDGQVIAKKRKAGRPSLSEVAAREIDLPIEFGKASCETNSSESQESAA